MMKSRWNKWFSALLVLITLIISAGLVSCVDPLTTEEPQAGGKVVDGDTIPPVMIEPPRSQKLDSTGGVRFPVCDVTSSKEKLPTKPYRDVIEERAVTQRNKKAQEAALAQTDGYEDKYWEAISKCETGFGCDFSTSLPDSILKKIPNLTLEAAPVQDIELVEASFHPFVAAVHHAYAKHYPLVISPDMIWLLIAQGFAVHVGQNAEELREHFVDFKGKKNLDIRRDGFVKGDPNNDWPGTFEEFSALIEKNTGKDLLELVAGSFSTTGPVEKAAFQVTLMDAMKSYFTYSVTTTCGIPYITLEGTVQDWEAIEEKVQKLAQYDLQNWVAGLRPILSEFTKAAKEGVIDTDFWKSIYKWHEVGSGDPYITGWILKFFPYKDRSGTIVPFAVNQKIDSKVQSDVSYDLVATTDEFPSGLSQADVLWMYHGTPYKMEFLAGFVGYYQNPKTLSLRPEISWAVVDKQMLASDKEVEDYHKGGDKDYLDSVE